MCVLWHNGTLIHLSVMQVMYILKGLFLSMFYFIASASMPVCLFSCLIFSFYCASNTTQHGCYLWILWKNYYSCRPAHVSPEMGLHLFERDWCRNCSHNLVYKYHLHWDCVAQLSFPSSIPETSRLCQTGTGTSHLQRDILGGCIQVMIQHTFTVWQDLCLCW